MTVKETKEWIYVNDIVHPPYKTDVILLTNKGVIAGYLIETNERGHQWLFYTRNHYYYSSARVLAYQPYPKEPEKQPAP